MDNSNTLIKESVRLPINLNDMADKSVGTQWDNLDISLAIDKDSEKLNISNDKNSVRYVNATSTGIITINGEKNDFSANGVLTLDGNIAIGCLVGFLNGSKEESDQITLSVHYDCETGEMCIPVSIGVISEDTEPINYEFGSVNANIQNASKNLLQIKAEKSDSNSVSSYEQIDEIPMTTAAPSDYISSLRTYNSINGTRIDLYGPKAIHPVNSGSHDVGIATRVHHSTFENYMSGKGYSLIANASGCDGPVTTKIYVDNSTSGSAFMINAYFPINSISTIVLPIPTSTNPANWGTIPIPTARTTCTQDISSTIWQMSRVAGFTEQLFSSNGMACKVKVAHRSNPSATVVKITGIANYQVFATKTNYVRVYESVSIQASYRPSIG